MGELEIFIISDFTFLADDRRGESKAEGHDKEEKATGSTVSVGEGVNFFEIGVETGEGMEFIGGFFVCGSAPRIDKGRDFKEVRERDESATDADVVRTEDAGVGKDSGHEAEVGRLDERRGEGEVSSLFGELVEEKIEGGLVVYRFALFGRGAVFKDFVIENDSGDVLFGHGRAFGSVCVVS